METPKEQQVLEVILRKQRIVEKRLETVQAVMSKVILGLAWDRSDDDLQGLLRTVIRKQDELVAAQRALDETLGHTTTLVRTWMGRQLKAGDLSLIYGNAKSRP